MAKKNQLKAKVEFIQVGKGIGEEHVLRTFENKPLVFTNCNSLFSFDVSERGPLLLGRNTGVFLHEPITDFTIHRDEGQVVVKSYDKEFEVSHGVELNLTREFYMISSFYDAERDKILLRLEMSKGFVEAMNLVDIIRLTKLDPEQ